ncbi:MAG: hypothetical protein AUK47_00165 [Deltaproteobacteria bacterium CG2_30_63_29]|nr:MAG: hypothetical protein AUK47_00165 [Deltaproteobacteria bacterium CG2_30_63_29]
MPTGVSNSASTFAISCAFFVHITLSLWVFRSLADVFDLYHSHLAGQYLCGLALAATIFSPILISSRGNR